MKTLVPRIACLYSALAAAALLAACSSSTKLNEVPVESRTPIAATGSGGVPGSSGAATTGATPSPSRVTTIDAAATAAAQAGRVVYFDYDSFVLKDEFKPLVEAHAKALVGNRGKRLVIEGHTDERGGREYNLALGQKRAEAVVRTLTLLGANDNQMESVSFGEERPAVTGTDDASWAKNRRAELRDR